MSLFGTKKRDPREVVWDMQARVRKESRGIGRQIQQIETASAKQATELKKLAKSNNPGAARILAREIVNARKTVSRLHVAQAQLNSIVMSLAHQASMVRMVGCLQRSTEVMQVMSGLVKIPEVQKTMMEMSKEMTKAGIMEEMMNDSIESAFPEADEAAVDSEVDKVLHEITAGIIGKAPAAVSDALPTTTTQELPSVAAMGTSVDAGSEDEGELDEMRARLEALKS